METQTNCILQIVKRVTGYWLLPTGHWPYSLKSPAVVDSSLKKSMISFNSFDKITFPWISILVDNPVESFIWLVHFDLCAMISIQITYLLFKFFRETNNAVFNWVSIPRWSGASYFTNPATNTKNKKKYNEKFKNNYNRTNIQLTNKNIIDY